MATKGRGRAWARWILGALVAAIAALSAVGWARLARYPTWVTDARIVEWRLPSGEPAPWKGTLDCDGDAHYLIDGERVWTSCSSHLGDAKGPNLLLRIDPARGEGRGWAMPPGVDVFSAEGMIPEPGGDVLAFVFYSSAAEAGHIGLYYAMAGPHGWIVSPRPVPSAEGGVARYLGGAWVEGQAEVVVTRPVPLDENGVRQAPYALRLAKNGSVSERRLPVQPQLDAFEHPAVEIAYRLEGSWHLWVREDTGGPVSDVGEDGSSRRLKLELDPSRAITDQVDAAMTGMLDYGHRTTWILKADGTTRKPPAAPYPSDDWRDAFSTGESLERRGDGIARRTQFATKVSWFCGECPNPARIEVFGDRVVSAQCPDFDLHVWDGAPSDPDGRLVARTGWCGELAHPAWLQRPSGGFWIVAASGRYIGLNGQLERDDPLSPLEHLLHEAERREKDLPSWWVLGTLGVVLSGLPASAIGLVLRRRRKAKAGPTSRRRIWAVGLALFAFAFVEMVCLGVSLPLMQ